MNDHDWLKEAAGALRDEHQGAPPAGADTRARMLATLHQRERQRRRWVSVLVPLAAVFLFSSAWAASTGRISRVFSLVPLPFSPAPIPTLVDAPAPAVPRVSAPAVSAAEPPASAPPVVAGSIPPSEPAPSPAASSAQVPAPVAAGVAPAAVTEPVVSAASKKPDTSEEDRLYREAHQAHFVDRNPARALAAWDAYLRAQKTGRFATEATYNRALTLLRLGRTAEARKALAPFAEGRFGSYRKDEARKLLDAL